MDWCYPFNNSLRSYCYAINSFDVCLAWPQVTIDKLVTTHARLMYYDQALLLQALCESRLQQRCGTHNIFPFFQQLCRAHSVTDSLGS